MKQVMDTEKFNEFSFLNQEEEITSRWSQSSFNAASQFDQLPKAKKTPSIYETLPEWIFHFSLVLGF